ncbi:MAG TPA: hypothetical protein VG826_15210 [Pirellulales bacterium]|nr:hypothetical protein [Pirellulales bacterium]
MVPFARGRLARHHEFMIPRPPPVTDSPLFWVLLFGSVGLVMLTAVEPKYIKRQERIARMQQTRERVHTSRAAGSPQVAPALRDGEAIATQPRPGEEPTAWQPVKQASLRPLMLFLACLLIVAMISMQVRRQREIARYRQTVAALEEGSRS